MASTCRRSGQERVLRACVVAVTGVTRRASDRHIQQRGEEYGPTTVLEEGTEPESLARVPDEWLDDSRTDEMRAVAHTEPQQIHS